jgi:predicted transcriptional regulator
MTTKKSQQSKQAAKPEKRSSRHDRRAIEAWQIDHIREGLRQADAGEFATEAQMKTTFSRRRK